MSGERQTSQSRVESHTGFDLLRTQLSRRDTDTVSTKDSAAQMMGTVRMMMDANEMADF